MQRKEHGLLQRLGIQVYSFMCDMVLMSSQIAICDI